MATYSGYTAASPMPAGVVPFSTFSPWKATVPATPTVLSNSALMVASVLEGGVENEADGGGGYTPIYWADSADPLVTLTVTGAGSSLTGVQIRCPAGAEPDSSSGGDKHMSVVQPNGDIYDFWQAEVDIKAGGTIKANGGGLANATSGTGVCTVGHSNAAGWSMMAGTIRIPEFVNNNIPHALVFSAQFAREGHIPPATADDGFGSEPNVPFEGQWFTIAYTQAEIEALSAKPWTKAVLEAIRKHGMYLVDKGGGGLGFKVESGKSYTSQSQVDPMVAYGIANGASKFEGKEVFHFDTASNPGVDWTRLRAINWEPVYPKGPSDGKRNFAVSTVATAPSPALTGTSLTLATGGAALSALMPATPFSASTFSTSAPLVAEIVRVTNIAGDVLTIERAAEETTARAIAIGWQFEAGVTVKTITDLEAAVAAANAAAIPVTQKAAASGVASLTAGGIGAQPPALHASRHAPAGSDPLTVSDLPSSVVRGSATDAFGRTQVLASAAAAMPALPQFAAVTDAPWGAKGNAKRVSDGAMTSGSSALSSVSAAFTSADVGKRVDVVGAGASGLTLKGEIHSVSAGVASLTEYGTSTPITAAASVTGTRVTYGTDDTAAINAAIAAASSAGTQILLVIPARNYFASTLTPASNVTIFAYGATIYLTNVSNNCGFHYTSGAPLANWTLLGANMLSDGVAYATGTQAAVYISVPGSSNLRVHDCTIRENKDAGISFTDCTKVWATNNLIENCCRPTGRNGISANFTTSAQGAGISIHFVDNTVREVPTELIAIGTFGGASSESFSMNVRICGNILETAVGTGIFFEIGASGGGEGGSNIVIADNIVKTGESAGIVTGAKVGVSPAENVTITGNVVISGQSPISVDGRFIVVANNSLTMTGSGTGIGTTSPLYSATVTLTEASKEATGVTFASEAEAAFVKNGDHLTGTGLPAGTYIVSGAGTTTWKLSAAATTSATETVAVKATSSNISITGNNIAMPVNSSKEGIAVFLGAKVTVTGNSIHYPTSISGTGQGILVSLSHDVDIRANQIDKSPGRAVLIEEAHDVTLGANTIHNCAQVGAASAAVEVISASENVNVTNNVLVDNQSVSTLKKGVIVGAGLNSVRVTGNVIIGATQTPAVSGAGLHDANVVDLSGAVEHSGARTVYVEGAAPTTGAWNKGDLALNKTGSTEGPFAWTCTTAGTPGTWTAWPIKATYTIVPQSGGLFAPGIVAPYLPQLAPSTVTFGIGTIHACRVIVPQSGHLYDLAIYHNVASGNHRLGIYDTGGAHTGERTLLYETGSVALAGAGAWQVPAEGSTGLAVEPGEEFDFVFMVDNTTATFARVTTVQSNMGMLPPNYWTVPGGAKPKICWQFAAGGYAAFPEKITEAQCALTQSFPCVIARVGT